jgi:hypothetical protein
MLHHSIQNVLEVTGNGGYNVASRASWNIFDTDVTTYCSRQIRLEVD